ncbi:hypothetical protein [uncultured Kordia sp.]|uniref:hypothetical protein n=1 Tax=uncultured Kordia sp. TaxID=507699 RepID=UPI0026069DC3|nr:hypothetical protein [uncultured Kordia sp.]
MCQISQQIKFCSCSDKLAAATKHLKSIYYVWTIERVSGISDFAMDGLVMDDPTQLDELSAEKILKELNSKNLFDFDYKPKDNDNLEIKRVNPKKRYEKKKLIGSNLNFYYLFDKWHLGYSGSFSYEYEHYKNGYLEITDFKSNED